MTFRQRAYKEEHNMNILTCPTGGFEGDEDNESICAGTFPFETINLGFFLTGPYYLNGLETPVAQSLESTTFKVWTAIPKEENIKDLKNISGLTWDKLAEIFNVSRRSLHNWADEEPLKDINQKKLSDVLNAIKQAGLENPVENRKFLLSGSLGKRPLDLLQKGFYEKFMNRAQSRRSYSTSKPLSFKEQEFRKPLPVEDMLDVNDEKIHRESNKFYKNSYKKKL